MNDVRAGFEFILSNALISLTGKLRPEQQPTCPSFLVLSPLFHFIFVAGYLIDWLIEDSTEEQEPQTRAGRGGPKTCPCRM